METLLLNFKKCAGLALLAILFSMGPFRSAVAQSDYQELAFRKEQPRIYITVFTLPGANTDELKLTTAFQLSNNFLAFKKSNGSGQEKFFSTAGLNLEVFKSPEKIKRLAKKGRWRSEEVNVEGLQSVGRDTWQDTAYAATYEQTKSDSTGLNGSMQVSVAPGYYTYLMQLKEDKPGNSDNNRRGDNRLRNSRTRNIHLSPYKNEQRDTIILVRKVDDLNNPTRLQLLNMGDNVPYGQDFYAFIHLPDFKADAGYSLQINRVEIKADKDDTTRINTVLQKALSSDQMVQNVLPRLQTSAKQISLTLDKKTDGYNYALVKIPNAQFPNAVYRLTIQNDETDKPVARGVFRSYWSNIPTSLLNLDVSIDMLHFITDDKTIKQIDSGSDREREQKFRAFWKKKDPTPDTEFNELEAEYYRRIDQAYEKFGSQGTPGYDTDRGRVYINFGKPQDVKRTFPTDGATTEVWTYPSHTFVFKATSGFGDFKLVSQK